MATSIEHSGKVKTLSCHLRGAAACLFIFATPCALSLRRAGGTGQSSVLRIATARRASLASRPKSAGQWMILCVAGLRFLRHEASRAACCLLALMLIGVGSAGAQEAGVRTGSYLGGRGPYDPRPFEDTRLGDRLFLGADFFQSKNRHWIEEGFAIGGYVSLNMQGGSEDSKLHSMSETLIIGAWEPLRQANEAGRWVFGLAHDHVIGDLTTREFADRQGLVETPDDLDTSPDKTFTTLGLLAWEHEFHTQADGGWGYRAGQLFAAGYFGSAVYLDDDRKFFMARPLAAAAGAQWVGNNDIGLGANVVVWRNPYYISLAAIDGKANRKYPDFDSLLDGELLYLGEVGIESDLDGPNEAIVRLTATHLDLSGENPEEGPGESMMFSAERRFGGRWAIFGRWSKSFRRLSADYRELLSAGGAWLRPFGFDQDFMGFGFFAGTPSDPAKSDEYGAELSYKVQLTQDFSVMPDLQYWYRSDPDSQRTSVWIAGVRANFEF